MNLQYISDSSGQTTGVFIPIAEWNELKNKFKGIEQEKLTPADWQMQEVKRRIAVYKKNPKMVLDFDAALNNIEKDL